MFARSVGTDLIESMNMLCENEAVGIVFRVSGGAHIFFFFQAEDGIRDVAVTGVQTCVFFFQAEDGIRDVAVTGVQTCALPISTPYSARNHRCRESRIRGNFAGEETSAASCAALPALSSGLSGGPIDRKSVV